MAGRAPLSFLKTEQVENYYSWQVGTGRMAGSMRKPFAVIPKEETR